MAAYAIKCCKDCQNRSVEPNCHGYCPTYLAEKMERGAKLVESREKSKMKHGVDDILWGHYWRRQKKRRRR